MQNRIEKLAKHDRSSFGCGTEALIRYFRRQAGQDQRKRYSVCFVAVESETEAVNIYVYTVPHYFFQWTSEIVQHLAEHGVSPGDFEAIVMDDASEVTISRSSGRPARIGVTDDGRVLFCVFDWMDGEQTEIEPRTAFEIGN